MNAGIETFEGGDAEAATTVGTSTVESGTSRVGERSARVAIVGGGTGGVAVAAALRYVRNCPSWSPICWRRWTAPNHRCATTATPRAR